MSYSSKMTKHACGSIHSVVQILVDATAIEFLKSAVETYVPLGVTWVEKLYSDDEKSVALALLSDAKDRLGVEA